MSHLLLPPRTCCSFTFYATLWILFLPSSVTFMYKYPATSNPAAQPRHPFALVFLIPLRHLQKYSYFRISSHVIDEQRSTFIPLVLVPLRNLQKYSYFRIFSHEIEKHGSTIVYWPVAIPCLSRF
jgi:hypothetical protein